MMSRAHSESDALGGWWLQPGNMSLIVTIQFSSVAQLCQIPCNPKTGARQASLSITSSWSPPKPMSIESALPSNHLILCRPLLLLPSIFPSIRIFSNESAQLPFSSVQSLSRVWLFATSWTAAHQAPPSMGFSRQEYWSGVSLPSLINTIMC